MTYNTFFCTLGHNPTSLRPLLPGREGLPNHTPILCQYFFPYKYALAHIKIAFSFLVHWNFLWMTDKLKTTGSLCILILDLQLVNFPLPLPISFLFVLEETTAHLLLYPWKKSDVWFIKIAAQTHKPLIAIGQVIYRCFLMDSCLGPLGASTSFCTNGELCWRIRCNWQLSHLIS